MAGPYNVTVEVDGRRYTGTWTLKQGGLICVCLPLAGARTVEIGKTRPEVKAATVLTKLVKESQAQREREQRAYLAKRRKLSPNSSA